LDEENKGMVETTRKARLISYQSNDAISNMAIDEAILEAHLQGLVPPTLRLYRFWPSALSIGYSQRLSQARIEKLKSHSIAIVRRPTGGRAVLHQNDLTYSFVGSSGPHDPTAFLAESVIGAYGQICQGLIFAFKELGIDLEIGRSKPLRQGEVDCFEATTVADLHYHGKKLVGSAQMRRKQAVLQHGSIILDQPQESMQLLIGENNNGHSVGTSTELAHHANLFEIVGRPLAIEEIEKAMQFGFERAFSVNFVPSPLIDAELSICQKLQSKYASEEFSSGASLAKEIDQTSSASQ
jgi:lipoyl(octanoyl) transferase